MNSSYIIANVHKRGVDLSRIAVISRGRVESHYKLMELSPYLAKKYVYEREVILDYSTCPKEKEAWD